MGLTGSELAELRRRLRSTQEELAEYLEVHPHTVSRWEQSERIPAWVPKVLEVRK